MTPSLLQNGKNKPGYFLAQFVATGKITTVEATIVKLEWALHREYTAGISVITTLKELALHPEILQPQTT